MTAQGPVAGAYHQAAATDAVFSTKTEGWTRPADRRRAFVSPRHPLSGTLDADEAQRLTLGADIAVAVLIMGEMAPVIRVFCRPPPWWVRLGQGLIPTSTRLPIAPRVIPCIGQRHPRSRSGRCFGQFEHWSQAIGFGCQVDCGCQHPCRSFVWIDG